MEPKKLHAGDSVAWGRAVPEYPASDGWALRYVLHGPQVIEIEAFDDHGVYRVEIEASSTEQWSPGQYRWAAFVVGPNDQRYTIDTGNIVIAPNWLLAEPGDVRSHAQRMLDLIEAALEKRIPKDQQSYEIDGQRLDRIPIERLQELRRAYRRELNRERSGSPFGRLIQARM
ncbi:head-tail joining [Halomonas phage phiHAP-1]|jgi:hypothetical protein|uniref:Uncharacterized protein n=1 Tax=Halomonas phage phiHAP-1 (isolate -/Gulf of Mexico/-/2001) TaxID=1283337 RepID=B0ZSF1_BPHA1|nr:head-tail joining [Halomonas phage phiHAP-1]ABY90371.1 conserved hypothetical protein [Halomonas phage phiHAP-1]|tara:strand:+ start:14571 stop:15086 length:516 start_codon:yes stop_codon:yes gene_type:complete